MSYFRPIGSQVLVEAITTPTTPFQLTLPSNAPIVEQMSAFRVLTFDSATEVHMAYGPTSAVVLAIAGAGGALAVGATAGVMTFGGAAATVGVGFLDYIVLPSNSFFSFWTATATADVYITPGQETAH